jgi:hypothetical protein
MVHMSMATYWTWSSQCWGCGASQPTTASRVRPGRFQLLDHVASAGAALHREADLAGAGEPFTQLGRQLRSSP